jgi:trans-2,3-dihydro-3-hydroxyanthranilate isomerase
MDNETFYFVDVFAEEKYAGNQLAVITDAQGLSDSQMQAIANEMHFSETTFIVSSQKSNGGFDVRIFTPRTEVPFAGHPTLGTAYVISHFLESKVINPIAINLKVGQIPVYSKKARKGGETLWMRQNSPEFGRKFLVNQFASNLGLDISDFESSYPIQEVSTGLPFIIVPLKTLEAVEKARVSPLLQFDLAKENPSGILLFCPQTCREENSLHVRVFVDAFGIAEDPATGSGNGCLSAYLSLYRFFGTPKVNIAVEQGLEVRRPSRLYLRAEAEAGQISVHVGGQVFPIAKGELL